MSDTIIHVKGLTAKVKLNNGEMLTTVNNVEFSICLLYTSDAADD